MADVRRAVRQALEKLQLLPDSLILAACSGGPDSLALASALAFEAPRLGLRAGAVIVDHGLQSGSDQVAQEALERCRTLGLEPVVVKEVSVVDSGNGMEAAARDARYAALEQARIELGAELILTGHSLEDQAETVLLGLARGSGLKSISGMPVYDPERKLLRPLLEVRRELLHQSLKDQGVDFWQDPHNQDPKFARVRVRKLLANLEEELGAGFVLGLSRSATIATEVSDFLEAAAADLERQARTVASAKSVSYRVETLQTAHLAVLKTMLKLVCERAGASSVSFAQIAAIEAFITDWHGQKPTQLSGITVERVKDQLVFTSKPKPGAC